MARAAAHERKAQPWEGRVRERAVERDYRGACHLVVGTLRQNMAHTLVGPYASAEPRARCNPPWQLSKMLVSILSQFPY